MDSEFSTDNLNRQRRAGILLHPTSLPGPYYGGDIGHGAYRFIEFLSASGFKVWQMLPMGPTHEDRSPYQCLSAHAGNPLLVSLDWLEDRGWLIKNGINSALDKESFRLGCLQQAGDYFYKQADKKWQKKLSQFVEANKLWLDEYSLFIAFKKKYNNLPWYEWPEDERHCDKKIIEQARDSLKDTIRQTVFEQFCFFTQWHEVREYAKQHKVEIFGDMPIFVARDSADVWAQRKNFLMDVEGNMQHVAGVPPDAFTETGQRWGNPLYDWDYMQQSHFEWWKQRFESQLKLFDIVRIDHFRGLQASWHIPTSDETAINGEWVAVPGKKLLEEMFASFENLPLVAEDLGVITDEVIKLKRHFELPGMKVLQFAFDGNSMNPHLPHMHEQNDLVYSGTHDNDTTPGWAENTANYNLDYFNAYASVDDSKVEQRVWEILKMTLSSVSFLAIIPMQDILLLGSDSRMNFPGTIEGNWSWRFDWQQLNPAAKNKISNMLKTYGR